jgi:hypothetical protein
MLEIDVLRTANGRIFYSTLKRVPARRRKIQ